MIKINSIASLRFYVKDLKTTADFYEKLGFRPDKWAEDSFKVYVNWFSIEFRLVKTAGDTSKTGAYTCVSVDNTDEYYEFVRSKGLQPEDGVSVAADKSREFTVTDPDGYRLLFFSKK